MRTTAAIAGGLLALGLGLGACNPEPEKAASTPAEQAAVPVASAAEAVVGPLSETDLRRVCRASLAAIHGQTVLAVTISGVEDGIVSAQWPAPVDGGVMKAQCRVEGNLVTWKPLDLPDPAAVRWMNQAGDPVNSFALKGDVVTVTVTMPDGTKQQSDLTVPANKEAA
jgi:hypothetical protein